MWSRRGRSQRRPRRCRDAAETLPRRRRDTSPLTPPALLHCPPLAGSHIPPSSTAHLSQAVVSRLVATEAEKLQAELPAAQDLLPQIMASVRQGGVEVNAAAGQAIQEWSEERLTARRRDALVSSALSEAPLCPHSEATGSRPSSSHLPSRPPPAGALEAAAPPARRGDPEDPRRAARGGGAGRPPRGRRRRRARRGGGAAGAAAGVADGVGPVVERGCEDQWLARFHALQIGRRRGARPRRAAPRLLAAPLPLPPQPGARVQAVALGRHW